MRLIHCTLFLVLFVLAGCVSFPDAPPPTVAPAVTANGVRSADGAVLGLQVWRADAPTAVILAVHGMNDYSESFALPGPWWAAAGITTYAIDQRGFGRSPAFGTWPGAPTMKADLRAAVAAVRAEHPGLPLFVLGHSMGAAVVLAAEADDSLRADGLILAAPGVWGDCALPLPLRMSANIAALFAPGKTLTGERAQRQATDNIEVLRKMAADPLVIKETRVDAILGVVRAMGEGFSSAEAVGADALVLYGAKDEIIPPAVMEDVAARLGGQTEVIRYPDGWHLLFRDLQRENVWRDVAAWIESRSGDRVAATD